MLHVLLRHPRGRVRDVSQDDHGPSLPDVLGPDAVGHLVSCESVHAQGLTSLDGYLGQGRTDSNGLEAELKTENDQPIERVNPYFASKGQVGVAEEADGDDGSAEEVRGVHVGHDAAPGEVVVDDCGVEPARPHQPGLLHRADDELREPVWDGVHLPPGVELLMARPPLRQLAAIRVTLSKEIFGP